VYAARQRRAAEHNADAARQQSQLALATLTAVIFDIQRDLRNLPAASELRRRLLTTALRRLEKLSGAFVEKASVDRHTAASLLEMGDLVLTFGEGAQATTAGASGSSDSARVAGAVEVARRLYERAHAILQALARNDPNNATARRDLSISYARLGDVQLQLGATDKALDMYQKGLHLTAALARAAPDNVQAQGDLSRSYTRLGDVQLRLGATDKALEMYQKGQHLSVALAQADPNNAEAQRDLYFWYNKLGDVHLRLGATDKALEMYQKGLDVSAALAQADRNNVQAQRDLSFS
jgi:tetratricopeptide (TPR) repeat protein